MEPVKGRKEINSLWWAMMAGWIQQLPVDGVKQPKGFFTTALFCWKPKATVQVGGHGPRWARAARQSARTRWSVPGRGSWLHVPDSIPASTSAGQPWQWAHGRLFRCISVRGKDVTVTNNKLCFGNDVKRKQEKAGQNSKRCFSRGKK